jgi:O-antigen/teichoic acid export membrane protein
MTMMTGTAIAQAIPILISPVLTRLYKPKEFGVLALYMAIAYVVSVVAAGRYELAVILPDQEEDAVNIVLLSLLCSLIVSILTFLVVLFLNDRLAKFLRSEEISFWLYFIPLTVLLTGIYNTFYYWSTRKLQYKRLVVSKVSQTTSTAILNLLMGLKGCGSSGLVVGGIAGQATTTLVLGFQIWKDDKNKIGFIDKEKILRQLSRYRNFPMYSIPADFINVLANQLPVYVFGIYFGGAVVGFYALTQRVLGAPISLIASSIMDVFKQRASSDYAKHGNCRGIFIKTLLGLTAISIVPFALFFYAAPAIFTLIFGEKWIVAGEYAQIMAIMFFFRFMSSPLSFVIYIAEKQNYDLVWQSALLVFTIISLSAGVYFNDDKISILCISLSYSVLYVAYLILSYQFSKGNKLLVPQH